MAEFSDYSRITPELEALAEVCLSNNQINKEDYVRYNVKRGLRDLDGTGVLAGTGEGLAGARSAKAVSRTVSVPPQLVTRGQKQVSGCSSAEPPGSLLASGETCWFQAILELVGTHIPLKALS